MPGGEGDILSAVNQYEYFKVMQRQDTKKPFKEPIRQS